jgi:hypothetical protein
MYNKKTLTFTFHHYWGVFCPRGGLLSGGITKLQKITAKLSHIMLYQVHLPWAGIKLITSVVIGIECGDNTLIIPNTMMM